MNHETLTNTSHFMISDDFAFMFKTSTELKIVGRPFNVIEETNTLFYTIKIVSVNPKYVRLLNVHNN